MSKIKSTGNRATEEKLVSILRGNKIRGWRRRAKIFGSPDFVFPSARVAVFVDGCFWHGCRMHGGIPKSNRSFWAQKIARNMVRDRKVRRVLRASGWIIVRIWQHELRQSGRVASKIIRALGGA